MSERCEKGAHLWVCLQREGSLGELVTETLLSADKVSLISEDSSLVDKVCPDGQVVCSQCRSSFGGNQNPNPQLDFSNLKEKLIQE